MQQNNVTSVRAFFEKMSTDQLDDILKTELHRDPPDTNAIRMILSILWEREKDYPVELTPAMEKAWEKYQRDVEKISQSNDRPRKVWNWGIRVASVAVIVFAAFSIVIPKSAEAESIWDVMMRLTSEFVEFFGPKDTESHLRQYEFQTENPGLQVVYDTAEEMGVTVPVVPMWLPDGNELVECKVSTMPNKEKLSATFFDGEKDTIFSIEIYNAESWRTYQKDDTSVEIKEIEGTKHNIMRNNDVWAVVWVKDNIECSIFVDCQEDTLYKILESIYVMEG